MSKNGNGNGSEERKRERDRQVVGGISCNYICYVCSVGCTQSIHIKIYPIYYDVVDSEHISKNGSCELETFLQTGEKEVLGKFFFFFFLGGFREGT